MSSIRYRPPNPISIETEQYGLYGQLRLSPLAGLSLVGGGRMTWWDTTTIPTSAQLVRGSPSIYSFDGRFTPYAGLVWDVTSDLNVYASYADSFTPQAPVAGRSRPDGRAIEPLTGQQYEAGTKLSLMEDKLLLSAAVYHAVEPAVQRSQ
jgi:outer-membrane receptor for ferric coprogen and ferric-rhodotorulic acid